MIHLDCIYDNWPHPGLDCNGGQIAGVAPVIYLGGYMRNFDTGATRDSDDSKLDYEGFLSPAVLRRYAEYMHANRVQSDGNQRSADNWQKGIPKAAYMKSLFRHFIDVWTMHRAWSSGKYSQAEQEEALCAVLFNTMGYLFEVLEGS